MSDTGPEAVAAGLLESVACTVRLAVPAVVGVPLTTQPVPSVKPDGKAPDVIVQEYGAVPPLTPTVAEYGVPTCPPGRVPVEIASGAGAIMSDTGPEAVAAGLLESAACTMRLAVPAVVGVPLTTHPLPRVKPAGSAPDVMVQE
jgi:hypothetical protein